MPIDQETIHQWREFCDKTAPTIRRNNRTISKITINHVRWVTIHDYFHSIMIIPYLINCYSKQSNTTSTHNSFLFLTNHHHDFSPTLSLQSTLQRTTFTGRKGTFSLRKRVTFCTRQPRTWGYCQRRRWQWRGRSMMFFRSVDMLLVVILISLIC